MAEVSIQLIAPASGAWFNIAKSIELDTFVSIQLIAPASGAENTRAIMQTDIFEFPFN